MLERVWEHERERDQRDGGGAWYVSVKVRVLLRYLSSDDVNGVVWAGALEWRE